MTLNNKNHNLDNDMKQVEESLKTTFVKEWVKRKEIKEKSKEIQKKVYEQKEAYIDKIESEYDERSQKIKDATKDIDNAIETDDVHALQKAFQNILDNIEN